MAWQALKSRISGDERSSLHAYMKQMKSLTKTRAGQYDFKRLQDARKILRSCSSAIACWIMPIDKVLENFPPSEPAFDLLIVDESSQCDLFSLSLLFRAKKVLIVGDDKQVSPEGVGQDLSVINQLIDKYLKKVQAYFWKTHTKKAFFSSADADGQMVFKRSKTLASA